MTDAIRKLCAIEGCARPAEKRGWCGGHYFRWRKHGSPTEGRIRNGAKAAFLVAFEEPQTDDCVRWPFSQNGNGYGSKLGGIGYPHRFVCEKFHGAPPEHRTEAAHNCGNRWCINPRHLRWATHQENMADRLLHGTENIGERCGTSKLTLPQVREIRSLLGSKTERQISKIYGVSPSAIYAIASGKTWGHVE